MKHVLAIDQGTTGSTCLVIRDDGAVVGRGYREISQHYPVPGWVEHDADEIFDRTMAAAREALSMAQVVPDAIGITNQRETVVAWNRRTGRVLHRAIVWQDRRTTERCRALEPHAPLITSRTGLLLDPYFSATKIEWLLARPDIRSAADEGELAVGTIDAWLVWRLTNGAVFATDHTNASRTMLYDLDAQQWSAELLRLFDIPLHVLPEVRTSSGSFGVAAREWLGHEIPVAGVAGDQQAALMGQGAWRAGQGKNTYGTGAFLLLNVGENRPVAGDGLLTTIACAADGRPCYALEASIFIAGAAVTWLRDGLGIISSASETSALAESLSGNDGVYFVPALTGLGAPHWEADARGTLVGLTRGTTHAHVVRAALEAMAWSTADVLDVMRRHSGVDFEMLRVDGGAASNDWLMQFQSDVLDVPVERPDLVETTASGAAALAGLAVGVWRDGEHFLASRRFDRFTPGNDRGAFANARRGWRAAVAATLAHAAALREENTYVGKSGNAQPL